MKGYMTDKIITFLNHSEQRKDDDIVMAKNFLNYWEELMHSSTPVHLKKGQKLFYEGHAPCGVFVIVAGKVNLFHEENQEKKSIGQLALYQPIGIDLLANEQPYPYTAIAEDDVKVYFISKGDLMDMQNCQSKGI